MAKRPKYSRWRRLPGLFRHGDRKWPDPNLEPQRLTLYLPGTDLDTAEALANRAGVETIQEYCAELLRSALEAERVREQVAEIEARRGPFEGLNQIADDPEYLAEWSAQLGTKRRTPTAPPLELPRQDEPGPAPVPETDAYTVAMPEPEVAIPEDLAADRPTPAPAPAKVGTPGLSASAEVVFRHAGPSGDDPRAFLPSLRRGESASIAEIAELARALQVLEAEYRGAAILPREVAYALHRLAIEAQVLHTDAFPGAFDDWTVDTIRAVQEAVDRILSGQDIRYYPDASRPEESP